MMKYTDAGAEGEDAAGDGGKRIWRGREKERMEAMVFAYSKTMAYSRK